MHLHIDCQAGLAGDMLLAALADAGADLDAIRSQLEALPLSGFEIAAGRLKRGGIDGFHIDVREGHDHEHGHEHGHGGHDGHGHDGPHRHLSDMLALLESPSVPDRAKKRAARIFTILGEAEARVHGVPLSEVHFHEISGIDTAVDVIGVCLALERFGVKTVSASIPAAGSGTLRCAHGVFPVPAPATLEILRAHRIPWRPGGEGERLTPTGAALLAGLAGGFGEAPAVVSERIGYGAGTKDFPDMPNLVRVILGHAVPAAGERLPATSGAMPPAVVPGFLPVLGAQLLPALAAAETDRVAEFRLAVDDMTPEAAAFLCDSCFSAGAVEAYAVPAAMKKGRLGHEITVLAPPGAAAAVAEAIWRNSSTFGMRIAETARLVLPREIRTVQVLGQTVRIKLGWLDGRMLRRQPEYDDCRAAALATGRPFGEILHMAAQAALELR